MEVIDRRFLNTKTKSVHAATIEFWEDHPVFSWFGGSREGAQDVSIILHNLNGEEKDIVIGSKDGTPRWNPILFQNDGKLWLFEKAGVFCDRWQTFVHNITDWTNDIPEKEIRETCQVIPAGLNAAVKTKPIALEDGRIVCGSAVETFCDWTSYFEFYRIKKGKWEFVGRTAPLNVDKKVAYRNPYNGRTGVSLGIIQPSLLVRGGRVGAFCRSSHGLQNVYYTETCQKGKVLITPEPTSFLNPNSGVDVVTIEDRTFLVYNPSSASRQPLVVDEIEMVDGEWKSKDRVVVRESIEESDRNSCISQELSYPYMIANDGKLHLVYTYGRSKIEYVTIQV